MPQGHNRHPNKRVKAQAHGMRLGVALKEAGRPDVPMPLIDIGIDNINRLIRDKVNGYDDAFQDAWAMILELDNLTPDRVSEIAAECYRQHRNSNITRTYTEYSIEAPIGNTQDEGFTRLDVIPSQPISIEEAQVGQYKVIGKKGSSNRVRLDEATANYIRSRLPGRPLSEAIPILLGLPVPEKSNEAWQDWEDDIIKERYPWGGSLAVSVDVKRSLDCIRERAQRIGVRATGFKPREAWITGTELTRDILKCHPSMAHIYSKKGYIEAIKVPYKGHGRLFFTRSAIIKFFKDHPFQYDHLSISSEWRAHVPAYLWDWLPLTKAVTELANRGMPHSKSLLHRAAKDGTIPSRMGYNGNRYIDIPSTITYLQTPRKRLSKRRPYRVATSWGGPTHFVTQDSGGDWYRVCDNLKPFATQTMIKRYGIDVRFLRGFPTCKRCLSILDKYRRDGKLKGSI